MNTKSKKLLGILILVVGLFVCIFVGVSGSSNLKNIRLNHSRPNDTYYINNSLTTYIEVKTETQIDVDNCFADVYDSFFSKNDTKKLEYERYSNGYYVFHLLGSHYTINSINFVNEFGITLNITKFTENEEIARVSALNSDLQNTRTHIIWFSVVGLLLTMAGIVLFLINSKISEILTPQPKASKFSVCKYCGTKNKNDDTKCHNCGSNLN